MRLFLLIVPIVFLLLACKKKTPEAEVVQTPAATPVYKFYPVSQELKDYGYFKLGSYWIYRTDTASDLTDSVYVKSVSTGTYSTWKNNDSIVVGEGIRIDFGFNNNSNPNGIFYTRFELYSLPFQCLAAFPTALNNKGTGFVVFELDSMHIAATYGGGMVENKSISNYVLDGVGFDNCRLVRYAWKYSSPSGPSVSWFLSKCYWKKNVGLVNDQSYYVWERCELLRYSVIQ
ncbi:MAG TPA: hypothetical protein PLQ93_05430 [Bacteroidia bacterium]|nr:hypothetical protein [Bacteroidia bacterium]